MPRAASGMAVAGLLALGALRSGAAGATGDLSETDQITVAAFEAIFEIAADERRWEEPVLDDAVWCLTLGRLTEDVVEPPMAVLEALAQKGHLVRSMRACETLPRSESRRRVGAGIARIGATASPEVQLDAWFRASLQTRGGAAGCLLVAKQVEDRWVASGVGCAASIIRTGDLGRARGSASSCDSAAPATPPEQRERDEIAVAAFAALIEAALQPPIEGCPPGPPAVWCLVSGPRPGDLEGVDPSAAVLEALTAKGYSVRGTQACADLPSTQLWPRAAAGIDCIPDPKGAARLRLDGWINVFERPRLGNCTIEMKKSGGHWGADAGCSAFSGIVGGLPCGPP